MPHRPVRGAAAGAEPAAPAAGPASFRGGASFTFAPSRNRSAPSTTTLSPTASPDETTVRDESVGPVTTLRTLTVLSSLTR